MDTVISLNGFCTAHVAQCEKAANGSSFKDLERLNIVIGSTKAHGYGYVLYENLQAPNSQDPSSLSSTAALKQVTYKDGYLNEALSKIGLPLKASEEEAMLMDGEFWPKNAGKCNSRFSKINFFNFLPLSLQSQATSTSSRACTLQSVARCSSTATRQRRFTL